MGKTYILYNPKAGVVNNTDALEDLKNRVDTGKTVVANVLDITDYKLFFEDIEAGDEVYILGGDGTLNKFINDAYDYCKDNDMYYLATGSGNDFLRDVSEDKDCGAIKINEYVKELPVVIVKGREYKFINGVGYGIDGYCCEVGDKQKSKSNKPVNYTAIAIKGLLFYYKPTNATVTVDGKEYSFKKVWIAPTMHGRYYGGGMMPAPSRKRDGSVELMIFHGTSALKTLMIFPSLFKGEHIKHTKHVTLLSGESITVRFDRPTTVQIDGETVTEVTEYTAVGAMSHSKAESKEAVNA